jgi:hypothetical protein
MLVGPEGITDWMVEFEVNLSESQALGSPALRLVTIGPLA